MILSILWQVQEEALPPGKASNILVKNLRAYLMGNGAQVVPAEDVRPQIET